jgi:hypothetical protein
MSAPFTIPTCNMLPGSMLPFHVMQGASVAFRDRMLVVQRRRSSLLRRLGVPAEPATSRKTHGQHHTVRNW